MPAGPDYIFFLQDKQRRFWQLDSAGEVALSANPYPLVYSPDGWQDTTIENIRNKRYWCVDRTVSIAFKYVEDGAQILKHIFYTKGIEEGVYLVICERRLDYTEGVEYGYWYKQTFRGEIDLSTFNHDGSLVTANTIEEGLAKHLKANENTVYEFPLKDAEKVKNDGLILTEKQNYITQTGIGTGFDYLLGVIRTTKEGQGTGVAFFDVFKQDEPGDLTTSSEYFMITASAITGIQIAGSLAWTSSFAGPFELHLKSSAGQDITLGTFSGSGPGSFDIDTTFNGAENEKFFLVIDGGISFASITETSFSISYSSRFKETYHPFLRPQFLFGEFINKMTDSEYSAEDCEYFNDLNNSDKVFTSGDAIRGIEEPVLKMSFTQFMSFWNTYDEVGIREKARKVLLDRKNALTDRVNTISLGEIAKPKISFDREFPYNELAVGYADVKNEEGFVNGKNEFNTTFRWSLGTIKTPKKYEKISQVHAGCYTIENLRIEQASKETTDNKNDNECFAMHIGKTLVPADGDIPTHYLIDRTLNANTSGVDNVTSVYNIIFSPKRCVQRSGDFLRSALYLMDSKTLRFTTADRNKDMEYINGSDIVLEKADIPVSSFDEKFFHPVIVNIDVDAPEDLLDDLDTNPDQCFDFDFEGNNYTGISLRNSVNPQTNKKQTYQLLLTADNDLTPLIKYFG